MKNTSVDKTDAKFLLSYLCQTLLNWPKSYLYSHDLEPLPDMFIKAWQEVESRRIHGTPVAYIVGHREFHNIDLHVAPGVLIPRPETEILVDLVIEEIERLFSSKNIGKMIRVLDLGTGSGAIALSIAKQFEDKSPEFQPEIIALDQSIEALEIAKKNCSHLKLNHLVQFVQSDWFSNISNNNKFNIIVSNPPYIPADDPHLTQGDLRFEPSSALTDGYDGLEAYRIITHEAPAFLVSSGLLLLEHGYEQAKAIQNLLLQNGFYDIKTIRDLANLERHTVGRR